MDGILLVDKPKGWTSHDVVAKVRSMLREASRHEPRDTSRKLATRDSRLATKIKVGHTGTLDPMATGLLILVVGTYTKRAQEFSKLDKVYEAELTLGSTSTTGDAEGEIRAASRPETLDSRPTEDEVNKILESFVGEQMQIPPAHSAIKIDGQRAHKLARAGNDVKMEARPVTIYLIDDIKYDYPQLSFATKVSSGTYIRSLAVDIGQKLGTGAYLSALRRTEVGKYKIDQATTLTKFTKSDIIAS